MIDTEKLITVEIETYGYGTHLASGWHDMQHFENNVYFNQGYVMTNDGTIINSKEIKVARIKNEYEVEK